MKMKSLIVLMGLCIAALSFKIVEDSYNLAEVDQIQGVYVFTDCKPVKEYEFLGTVKTGAIVGSVKHKDIMSTILKKANRDYPEADGVILSNDYFSAEAIKFK